MTTVDFIYPDGTAGYTDVPALPTPLPGAVLAASPETGMVHVMHQASGGSIAHFHDSEQAARFVLDWLVPWVHTHGVDLTCPDVYALNREINALGFPRDLPVALLEYGGYRFPEELVEP